MRHLAGAIGSVADAGGQEYRAVVSAHSDVRCDIPESLLAPT